MKLNRLPLFIYFLLMLGNARAKPIHEAFEALRQYDYFKAKGLFFKSRYTPEKPYAEYGLACIFSRKDNPFFDLDSAGKYIHSACNGFFKQGIKQNFSGFIIDSLHLHALLDSVSEQLLVRTKKQTSAAAYDLFLERNYLASKSIVKEAIYLRDELEFNAVMQKNHSDSTNQFMICHPQSSFYSDALLLKDRQVYDEQTQQKTASAYLRFIKNYPNNGMLPMAYENVYAIYRQNSDKEGLKQFVYAYPKAAQHEEAWKLLFSLSVKSFSDEELIRFLAEYPEFPLKNSILKDLQLSRLNLFPYHQEELVGFVDSSGSVRIKPQYDSVTYFSEGLSVVTKNDSVFYVNKENENSFGAFFEEAYEFKNGVAAVKQNNTWFFINRQAQPVSPAYEEINELSENTYVVKIKGKYGALNRFGQTLWEARFDELGNFKNGMAYYSEAGKYGFVSLNGFIHKAEFDWISDFERNHQAIYKLNNKYGLINSTGQKVLEAAYDQVIRIHSEIYLLILNNRYGFYSSQGCYLTEVNYEYSKERPESDYYKEGWMRLIKNNKQGLMDENGAVRVNFGVYDELGFANDGLFKVKKKNKYGYVDRKLHPAIPYQYEWAGDFEDSLALVKSKLNYQLINTSAKVVMSSNAPIQKISAKFYLLRNEDGQHIADRSGKPVLSGIRQIQRLNTTLFIITLNNGEIKLLKDETFVNLNSKI